MESRGPSSGEESGKVQVRHEQSVDMYKNTEGFRKDAKSAHQMIQIKRRNG